MAAHIFDREPPLSNWRVICLIAAEYGRRLLGLPHVVAVTRVR